MQCGENGIMMKNPVIKKISLIRSKVLLFIMNREAFSVIAYIISIIYSVYIRRYYMTMAKSYKIKYIFQGCSEHNVKPKLLRTKEIKHTHSVFISVSARNNNRELKI